MDTSCKYISGIKQKRQTSTANFAKAATCPGKTRGADEAKKAVSLIFFRQERPPGCFFGKVRPLPFLCFVCRVAVLFILTRFCNGEGGFITLP